jgi:hypothetical protein
VSGSQNQVSRLKWPQEGNCLQWNFEKSSIMQITLHQKIILLSSAIFLGTTTFLRIFCSTSFLSISQCWMFCEIGQVFNFILKIGKSINAIIIKMFSSAGVRTNTHWLFFDDTAYISKSKKKIKKLYFDNLSHISHIFTQVCQSEALNVCTYVHTYLVYDLYVLDECILFDYWLENYILSRSLKFYCTYWEATKLK